MSSNGAEDAAPPIGVYVHWPYCARICPYCDFAVVRDRGRQSEVDDLVAAVLQDLIAQAAAAPPRRLVSMFFGGGTPSLMDPEDVAALIAGAKRAFPAHDRLEVTLEANPTDAEIDRFEALRAAGVTRLSVGIQSLRESDLHRLGRNHGPEEGRRALRLAGRTFPRVSADFIYGLPGQTPTSLGEDFREASQSGCEHISAYELTIEPKTALEREVRRGLFTPLDPEAAAALMEAKAEILEALGFDAYEVSNHARGDGAWCRHNLLYWRGEDYLGVGPSAHGRVSTSEGRRALIAARRPRDYILRVRDQGTGTAESEILSPIAAAEERLLLGLRCLEGVTRAELQPLALSRLPELLEEGFLEAQGGRIRASRRGRLVLNRLIEILAP